MKSEGADIIRTLVISDIHGCIKQFNELLELINYNSSKDQLILLGDYVDRGLCSKEVIEKVMQLVEEGAIALRGNHDQMMLNAFDKQEDALWLNNGGFQTITSYIGNDVFEEGFNWDEYIKTKRYIRTHYGHHLDFMNSLPFYHETDNHIFVHAGINPTYEDWKMQPDEDFIWIRDIFFNNATYLDKTVVFGHTPTPNLHKTKTADIWFAEDKIGIDGGCAYGYQLNCLEVESGDYMTYKVLKNQQERRNH